VREKKSSKCRFTQTVKEIIMAVNKPVGDNARKAGEEANSA
jgi:hypothetical protein